MIKFATTSRYNYINNIIRENYRTDQAVRMSNCAICNNKAHVVLCVLDLTKYDIEVTKDYNTKQLNDYIIKLSHSGNDVPLCKKKTCQDIAILQRLI